MMRVYVAGVGVFGPGCIGWPVTRALLARDGARDGLGATVFPQPIDNTAPPAGELLPATERRRATPSTRLALTVAQEALAAARVAPMEVPAVFASSSGNPGIIHDLCATLAANDFQISPTKFHNSVHNAASGYYSIATSCRRGATTLCAYDASAAAALLEATTQAQFEAGPVLLVSYDIPYPPPLSLARPMLDSWGVALVLQAQRQGNSCAQLEIAVAPLAEARSQTQMADAVLERARVNNPTARLLPLLRALARIDHEFGAARAADDELQRVAMPGAGGGALRVDVARC